MNAKPMLYVGAAVLFLIGLCLLAFGGITLYGSTAPTGQTNWAPVGIALGVFGLLLLAGGAGMIVAAQRGQKTEIIQQLKVDLPGQTKIEEVKCRSCGGTLSAKDITLANGAPMVHCPYCHTVYQMTEEPKW